MNNLELIFAEKFIFNNKKLLPLHEKAISHNAKEIEIFWKEESGKRKLFNSTILNLNNFQQANSETLEIDVAPLQYKYYLAQKANLISKLTPLAISGITWFAERSHTFLLFAKRSTDVTQYPEHYELAPSGSLDYYENQPVSIKRQINEEIKEEIGIEPSHIAEAQPFCLIYDPNQSVYDIGVSVKLNFYQPSQVSNEYSHITPVALCDVDDFLYKNSIVPTSKLLFLAWREKYGKQT